MAQVKQGLFETQVAIGQIAEEATQQVAKGEKLKQSQIARKNVLQYNQWEVDARATLELILVATGRACDKQGAHFHIWPDNEKTRDIVTSLGAFILGMEQAREKKIGEPKNRKALKVALFDTSKALINEVHNETGLDYLNMGDWEKCALPFATCPNVKS